MPHSLRVRLKNLNYKGLLTDRELNRLVNALDIADNIEDIKTEIMNERDDIACGIMAKYSSDEAYYNALGWALKVIDKHISGDMRGDTE